MLPSSGHVTGIISVVAFNFMVHDPNEIIECTIDKSLFSNRLMYRNISCSAWYELNTGCAMKDEVLTSSAGHEIAVTALNAGAGFPLATAKISRIV